MNLRPETLGPEGYTCDATTRFLFCYEIQAESWVAVGPIIEETDGELVVGIPLSYEFVWTSEDIYEVCTLREAEEKNQDICAGRGHNFYNGFVVWLEGEARANVSCPRCRRRWSGLLSEDEASSAVGDALKGVGL